MNEPKEKANKWLSGEPFVVQELTVQAFHSVNKPFLCKLCGHVFRAGDTGRFVYTNGAPGIVTGNFFTCQKCDGPDVMQRAKESLELAIKLAKKWDIYGPDWRNR